LNFCFFGSEYDAKEWGQKGIKNTDLPEFSKFLSALFNIFEFEIGAIAYENDCTLLFFEHSVIWPNEFFTIKNIDIQKILKNIQSLGIVSCLINTNKFKGIAKPTFAKLISKKGLLIENKVYSKTI